MDYNRAEPTCYRTYFCLRQFQLTKWSLFVHTTTRINAPYVHPMLDSILDLCPGLSDLDYHDETHMVPRNAEASYGDNYTMSDIFTASSDMLTPEYHRN